MTPTQLHTLINIHDDINVNRIHRWQRLNNYHSDRSRHLTGSSFVANYLTMPTIVPRHRDSLPHAEGGQPLDAGGRKRRRKDDSNSDDDSWRPKSMRQKRNQHPTAADPPLSQKLPPKMKARQDSIRESRDEKLH